MLFIEHTWCFNEIAWKQMICRFPVIPHSTTKDWKKLLFHMFNIIFINCRNIISLSQYLLSLTALIKIITIYLPKRVCKQKYSDSYSDLFDNWFNQSELLFLLFLYFWRFISLLGILENEIKIGVVGWEFSRYGLTFFGFFAWL